MNGVSIVHHFRSKSVFKTDVLRQGKSCKGRRVVSVERNGAKGEGLEERRKGRGRGRGVWVGSETRGRRRVEGGDGGGVRRVIGRSVAGRVGEPTLHLESTRSVCKKNGLVYSKVVTPSLVK